MTLPAYPLAEVLQVKQKRVEKQELVVQQKKDALEAEEKRLKEAEKKRDLVKKHLQDKLKQLRDELDGGTTSDKVTQMKVYIKEVQIKLAAEEKLVQEQMKQVQAAKAALAAAKEELRQKRVEVDKLKTHREDWTDEEKKNLRLKEEKDEDEMGNVIFLKHTRERK